MQDPAQHYEGGAGAVLTGCATKCHDVIASKNAAVKSHPVSPGALTPGLREAATRWTSASRTCPLVHYSVGIAHRKHPKADSVSGWRQ